MICGRNTDICTGYVITYGEILICTVTLLLHLVEKFIYSVVISLHLLDRLVYPAITLLHLI